MAWLAVNEDGREFIFQSEPDRFWDERLKEWNRTDVCNPSINLPKGSIAKLIGRALTWEDEPVELKD